MRARLDQRNGIQGPFSVRAMALLQRACQTSHHQIFDAACPFHAASNAPPTGYPFTLYLSEMKIFDL